MREPLLSLQGLPILQNRVFPTREAAIATPRGDVTLAQDSHTGIVVNRAFDPDRMRYDADYQNEQAHSPAFRSHLQQVLGIVQRHFPDPSIVEIGCGKGYFLELLLQAGYSALGVDPAYEGERDCVIRSLFTRDLGISAPALVLRHTLEHVQDPIAFLRSIAAANGGGGTIYIEVPCFDWIREHRAWFDVFYEHVNYFRASDFQRMFAHVLETGHLFGGQYLYVVADLASLRQDLPAAETVHLPQDFMAGIERCERLAGQATQARAIWGGSSKGVLFAQHLARRGVDFDAMIDINPVKQGRFAAGTGLPILGPEEALARVPRGATVFVMNSNYYDEIAALVRGQYQLIRVDTP